MFKIEILITCVSFAMCALHVVLDFVFSRKNGKKIDKLCDKCGLPVYEDSVHNCPLSDEQLTALYDFVVSVRGGHNGVKH